MTVKALLREIADEESIPLGKGYQIEKRVIGNDDVGDRIYSLRIHTARAESMPGRNLVNLVKVFFLSALALGLGLPHQSTLATLIMVAWPENSL